MRRNPGSIRRDPSPGVLSAPGWTMIKPKRFDQLASDLLEPVGRKRRARAVEQLVR
jgi:hypothetical protein